MANGEVERTTGQPPDSREREAAFATAISDVATIVNNARSSAARSVNAALTSAYWLVGQRIVEFEQSGQERAEYGEELIAQLADELTSRFGRGFSRQNLQYMRQFFLTYSPTRISQTASGALLPGAAPQIRQTASGESDSPSLTDRFAELVDAFPLPWSSYVRLLSVSSPHARQFYEAEAIRGGWSVRQLDRQIKSQFYERTALSKNKAAMLESGKRALPEDTVLPTEAIKDPFVLEFLDLKDEYSESDLEEALVLHLQSFLLELGDDYCFVSRQRRLRIGNQWFRVDLLFYHRGLRSLVVIDLKIGNFSHADAGQMNLYLNYARDHWTRHGENPPIGLILCSEKDETVARYALDGLHNEVLAAEYRSTLPDEEVLAAELERTREVIDVRFLAAAGAPTARITPTTVPPTE